MISALEKAQPHWSLNFVFCDYDNELFLRLKKRSPIEAILDGFIWKLFLKFLRLKKRSPIEAWRQGVCAPAKNKFLRLKKRSPIEAYVHNVFVHDCAIISALEKAQPHWSS